jgi:hypothetical protein
MPHRAPACSGPAVGANRSVFGQRWSADLSAFVKVFLVALPLSLGIAPAAGAPLRSGLVAGAVGELVRGWLGGAPPRITGPPAGLTVVTAELVQRYGWQITCAVTVLAALARLGLGFQRVAPSALAVSLTVAQRSAFGGLSSRLGNGYRVILRGQSTFPAVLRLSRAPAPNSGWNRSSGGAGGIVHGPCGVRSAGAPAGRSRLHRQRSRDRRPYPAGNGGAFLGKQL